MKRYLVTGASRGIGRVLAERLLAEGAQIAVVARDERALLELAQSAPGQVVVMVGDLMEAEHRARIAKATSQALEHLDGVVLCAGIAQHEPFVTMSERSLRQTFEVNFFAPALLARDLCGLISDGGSITFVSSTLASRAVASTSAYAASKAAVESLTRTMALELAPRVRVNAVAPGLVDTAMTRDLRLEPGESRPSGAELNARLEAQHREMAALHPMQRMGTADEVARAIVHLMESSWSTGTVLTLDGGLSL